jgi:membrane fusion protein (multidrug efflux system)
LQEDQNVAVRVAAYPDEVFQGRIRAISPAVDAGTRNVRVRAQLPNPDGRLRPGMFAKVETLLPQREQVLTLPRRAVSFNTYGDSVFVIEEAEQSDDPAQTADAGADAAAEDQPPKLTVTRRQIRTGEVRGDEVEIIDGLAAGDRVVLAGHQKLRNGAEVQIVPDDGVAPQTAASAPVAP